MQRRARKANLLTQLESILNLSGKQQIGIGTFAQVFKVFDKRDHQFKALRQLQKSKQSADEVEQQKEINEKLMKIDHPNILKVFEIFEDDEQICYLTEYCEGGSLWDTLNFIKGKKFSEVEAVQIVLEAAKAVQVLHGQGITHRDLKPENILFVEEFEHNKRFEIKLADFGLSTNKMLMETIAGTKEYIAPEQIRKDKYTKAVDIWALGIIFDQLIHGVPFFTGDSHQETFHMIINRDFKVRSESVTSETKALLARMIKRYPSQRPKIEEVVQVLDQLLKNMRKASASSTPSRKSEKGDPIENSPEFAELETEDEGYYCTKHPQETLLRKRKTKETTCSKCIEQDPNLISVEEYLKILEEENRFKKAEILKEPQIAQLSAASLSGLAKNDKIHKELQLRKDELSLNFTKTKSRFSFLNQERIGEEHMELFERCQEELRLSSQEYSKTLANYNDLVLSSVDSKVQKFLDSYFKDV